MTILTGNLQSVSGTPFGGPGHFVVIYSRVTRPGFSADALILELQDRIPMTTTSGGYFQTEDLDPGPIRVELEGGTVHGRGWDVDLPESGTHSLANLVDAQVEWSPAVVGRAEAAATEAAQAAVRAESAAVLLESAAATAADLVRVEVSADADRAIQARQGAETAQAGAETARGEAQVAASEATASATNADTAATAAAGSASDAASSATSAATSADEAAIHEDTSLDASAAAIAAAWSFDGFTPAQVADAALRAEDAAARAEASGGGIAVVGSEEEAAALPIGTVYVIAAEVAPGNPVAIVGTAGENITTDTFTPTIPNATTGDTIIIAANTKAVGGSTLTAPAGFTTITDGYWAGTQRSWVFSGPWSDDLTITADQPLEFAWAAVAVRGSSSVTWGETKDRGTEPAESTTVTAPSVDHGPNDLTIGITFERTSAAETPEQVTVNEGWTIEHYTAQGANFQTTLIGTGGTGDMVATYPNPQATNGVGVQVVAHA